MEWVSALGWATTETPTALIQQTTTQVLGILNDLSLQGPLKRQEFIPLFKEVVEQAYMDRLTQAAQQEKAIRYTGEQGGASQAVVATHVTTQSDQEIPIDYYLHEQ